jgi:8-oxo-dGTP pyrophosphatase MutT (NUDIX family)
MIIDWQIRLKERLQAPLPGLQAQDEMAPPQRFEEISRYQPNAQTRRSAVLILLYPQEQKLFFPLILRPENSGVHSGQIALPGGRKDEEDIDLIHTALREAEEEIGVIVPRHHVLGQLSEFYVPPSNFLVYPVVAWLDEKPAFYPSKDEVVEIFETDLWDFVLGDKRKIKTISTKYMQSEVPYFDLHNQTVWGATAMILSEFRWILKEIHLS